MYFDGVMADAAVLSGKHLAVSFYRINILR